MSLPPSDDPTEVEGPSTGLVPFEQFDEVPPEQAQRERKQITRLTRVLLWTLGLAVVWYAAVHATVLVTDELSFLRRAAIASISTLGIWLVFILIRRRVRHKKLWASGELPPPIKPSRFTLRYGKLEPYEMDKVYYERCLATSWLLVAALSPPARKEMPTRRRLKLLLRGALVHLLVVAITVAVAIWAEHPAVTPAVIGVGVLYIMYFSVVFWFWFRRRLVVTIIGPKEFTRHGAFGDRYEPELASNYTVVKDGRSAFEWWTRSATVSVESKDQEGSVAIYRWVADYERFAAVLRAISKIAHKGTEHDTTEARI